MSTAWFGPEQWKRGRSATPSTVTISKNALHRDNCDVATLRNPDREFVADVADVATVVRKCAEQNVAMSQMSQPSAAPSGLTAVPAPCAVDLMERAAIISEGSGLSRIASETLALEAVGLKSFSDLADAHVARISTLIRQPRGEPSWRARISRTFLTNDEVARLASTTLDFLKTDHFREALRLEWSEVQLFGICPIAPVVRVDSSGLITGLALSPHNRRDRQGRYHQTKLESIDANGATTITPGGSRHPFDRFHVGLDLAVPWWELCVLQV
jgi:hypothetical protein